jgi:hypothetical protein
VYKRTTRVMALRSEALEEEATETTAFLPIFVASFIDERSRELRQGFVPSLDPLLALALVSHSLLSGERRKNRKEWKEKQSRRFKRLSRSSSAPRARLCPPVILTPLREQERPPTTAAAPHLRTQPECPHCRGSQGARLRFREG